MCLELVICKAAATSPAYLRSSFIRLDFAFLKGLQPNNLNLNNSVPSAEVLSSCLNAVKSLFVLDAFEYDM